MEFKLAIKETSISDTHVEMVLTDGSSNLDDATAYAVVRVPRHQRDDGSPASNRVHLVAIQAEALRSLRDAIDERIASL
jgi:hypothetical protein